MWFVSFKWGLLRHMSDLWDTMGSNISKSQEGKEKKRRETTCPDSALQARLPSVWLCRAPSGLPSWEESKVTDKGICQTGRTSLDKNKVCYGDNKAQIIVKLHRSDSSICFAERSGGGKRGASGFTLAIPYIDCKGLNLGWGGFDLLLICKDLKSLKT